MLERYKADRAALNRILESHEDPPAGQGSGLHKLHQIYLHILRDALSALTSIIQYLDR
jgi:hypothetical protein